MKVRQHKRPPKMKVNRQTFIDHLGSFWEGQFLVRSMTPRAIRWVVAGVLFCLLSIFNSNHSLRQTRQVAKLDEEINELRMEYVSTSSMLMGEQRLSSIEKRVSEEGLTLTIPKNPPIVIGQ